MKTKSQDELNEQLFQKELDRLKVRDDILYMPRKRQGLRGHTRLIRYCDFLWDLYHYVAKHRGGYEEVLYRKLILCWNLGDDHPRNRCSLHTICPLCSSRHNAVEYWRTNISKAAWGKYTWMFVTLTLPLGGYEDSERLRFVQLALSELYRKIGKKKGKVSRAISFSYGKIDIAKKLWRRADHYNIHVHLLVQVEKQYAAAASDWLYARWNHITSAEQFDAQEVVGRDGENKQEALERCLRYMGHCYDIDGWRDIVRMKSMTYRQKLVRKYGRMRKI